MSKNTSSANNNSFSQNNLARCLLFLKWISKLLLEKGNNAIEPAPVKHLRIAHINRMQRSVPLWLHQQLLAHMEIVRLSVFGIYRWNTGHRQGSLIPRRRRIGRQQTFAPSEGCLSPHPVGPQRERRRHSPSFLWECATWRVFTCCLLISLCRISAREPVHSSFFIMATESRPPQPIGDNPTGSERSSDVGSNELQKRGLAVRSLHADNRNKTDER